MVKKSGLAASIEVIQEKIYLIRGHKVMLDRDLAELYGVDTKRLKEQVKRNLRRFPHDFMFELTWDETLMLAPRSQFATMKKGGNTKYLPYVFTEQGVAMLSSVLSSDRAIDVNIQIMRVFTKIREMMTHHKDLARKIEDLEAKFQGRFKDHDHKFVMIFNAIRDLLSEKEEKAKKKSPMGFIPN